MSDSLGVYIHIPFCIQRCSYCDFATYAKDQIQANDQYVETLCLEATKRQNVFKEKTLKTLYFGGGTPSLLSVLQIKRIIDNFKSLGYLFDPNIEITMEVNPATLNDTNCAGFRDAGVNRISIGCQTFDDKHLKVCNREHNAKQTMETINLVKKYFSNYSLDLLFSLPEQGLKQVSRDLKIINTIDPPHVSAYCLTLNEKHPMNKGRCPEDEQVEMFALILQSFKNSSLFRYEISNFSKEGYQSRHNNLYWQDQNYWGLGLSAHSYKRSPRWGTRFWNPSNYQEYMKQIKTLPSDLSLDQSFSDKQKETLAKHESLTDYCHTHLRLMKGLSLRSVRQKFGALAEEKVASRLAEFVTPGFLENHKNLWMLTEQGILLSNQVFSGLLFSHSDIDKA